MLLGRLFQLVSAVLERAFAEQVDALSAARPNPVDGGGVVHKSQHLYARQHACAARPFADERHGTLFAVGHAGRSHLDAVYVKFLQEQARNEQLFVGHERHAAGLFAVAECRVHDFYFQAFRASHASIFWRFSSRKSMSSRAFIRQYFL
ncbi:unknown [Prevotella sp. CAG:617]|nr:unknown [Prevotella sp. CAG:617]